VAEPARWRSPPLREHGGGLDEAARASGLPPGRLCDFSVNVNPYGPSPALLAAVRAAPLERYPDPTAAPVRRAIAARLGVDPGRVVFGNGATDLLWTLARVALGPGARLLSVEPAFSELRAAAEASGAEVVAWRPPPGAGLAVDLDAVAAAAGGAALVALCTPTSPAGLALDPAAVAALAARLAPALVLLDESFLPLSDRHADLGHPMPERVLRLRSLTKAHAIPGLRAGYLVAPRPLAEAVEATRPAWSTSAPAQAAALAALDEEAFVAASRERLRRDREALAAGLRALGLAPLPSVAPYLAFEAPGAAALRARLLGHGLLVRDCASFGLPGWLRVAARPAAERDRLLAALATELR
jgi:histidinol-phosphate/aromatic aminotransferase/cobyric acid decarboxylase-like protein